MFHNREVDKYDLIDQGPRQIVRDASQSHPSHMVRWAALIDDTLGLSVTKYNNAVIRHDPNREGLTLNRPAPLSLLTRAAVAFDSFVDHMTSDSTSRRETKAKNEFLLGDQFRDSDVAAYGAWRAEQPKLVAADMLDAAVARKPVTAPGPEVLQAFANVSHGNNDTRASSRPAQPEASPSWRLAAIIPSILTAISGHSKSKTQLDPAETAKVAINFSSPRLWQTDQAVWNEENNRREPVVRTVPIAGIETQLNTLATMLQSKGINGARVQESENNPGSFYLAIPSSSRNMKSVLENVQNQIATFLPENTGGSGQRSNGVKMRMKSTAMGG